MRLSSIDYAILLSWLAYFKHGIVLNKTQLQKLLFICYGRALATENVILFDDDTPKAWPFGPVFPRVYKRYQEAATPELTEEQKCAFSENPRILMLIVSIMDRLCHLSATRLSDWSHRVGSPWYDTVFSSGTPEWNREINPDVIKSFFANDSWETGL